MAANSAVEVIEPNMQDKILETTSPIASGRLTLRDTNVSEQAEITNEIVDEVEDAEIDSLLELRKCKEWLLQQKINQQSELLVRRLQQREDLQPSSNESTQSDLYERSPTYHRHIVNVILQAAITAPEVWDLWAKLSVPRISKLQDQLYSLSTARSYKKLVLDRLLCGDQLIKKLFPDVVTESPTEEHIEEMKAFARLCEKQNKLSTDILIEHEALLDAQTVLDKVRQQSYEKKKENRGFMKSLQSLKEDQEKASSSSSTDNAQIQKLKQQIATKVEKIDIVRNVFQGVIVGSGLDWASDDDMKRLVLSLGEVLEFAA